MIKTLRYGPSDNHEADLHLPDAPRPPVVCLLHGGFWRMPYGRHEFDAVARDLAARGFAVWNIEYQRVGAPGGGWPGTINDVASAIDHLDTLSKEGVPLDLERVVVCGHSAGGHLALWSAATCHPLDACRGPSKVRPAAAIGLAAIADLDGAFARGLGSGAVEALLGGPPNQHPDRYAAASPLRLLPLGVRQLLLHGAADEAVPVELTRRYIEAARQSGDAVEYIEFQQAGHMDYLNPGSETHSALCRWLESRTAGRFQS